MNVMQEIGGVWSHEERETGLQEQAVMIALCIKDAREILVAERRFGKHDGDVPYFILLHTGDIVNIGVGMGGRDEIGQEIITGV
ncbi:MAG: hypothetical protein EBR93_05425 [Bacteroidetes bacterium]|nr:hypothetical protein [Bacteroidota bacterium]